MKRKFILFLFLLVMCLSLINLRVVSEASYADPDPMEVEFTISNDNQQFHLSCENPSINKSYASWSDVLQKINDNIAEENVAKIIFDSFNLDLTNEKYLEFDRKLNLILTGNISSNSEKPLFKISASGVKLQFQNISINSDNSQFVVEFESEGSSIYFFNDVEYSNANTIDDGSYFVKYKTSNNIYADNCNTNLKLYIDDLNLYNTLVIHCDEQYYLENVKISFAESVNIYNTPEYIYYLNGVVVNSYVDFAFDLNGGYIVDGELENFDYDEETENYIRSYKYNCEETGRFLFPNEDVFKRTEAIFEGLFGKIEIGNKTYYFDKNILQEFLQNDAEISEISTYFKENLSETDNQYCFIGFNSQNESSLDYYLHFKIFNDNDLQPTYVCKWKINEYKINYYDEEPNTEEVILLKTESIKYDEEIPQYVPTRTGYSFDGWYLSIVDNEIFDYEKMPAQDFNLFAKWSVINYTLSFNTNGGTPVESQLYHYLDEIERPEDNPTREGYEFDDWYADADFSTKFVFEKMPAEDTVVYAKWNRLFFKIYVYSNIKSTYSVIYDLEYGSNFPEVYIPVELGYEYVGMYADSNYEVEFDTNCQMFSNIKIYLKYLQKNYKLTLVKNNGEINDVYTKHYKDAINLPTLTKDNYKFGGWYSDENFENINSLTTMPNEDVTLYAKWISKQVITLNLEPQTYTIDGGRLFYVNNTEYQDLKIQYYVDDEWTTLAPTEVGSYKIWITRAEDEDYFAVDLVLENGFNLIQEEVNLKLLIIILYSATIAEIAVSIVVRIMLKRKLSYKYVVVGSVIISSSQLTHLIVSGLMFLAGFVFMTYQIVLLTRSITNEHLTPSKQDNRERFKEDLAFQNDSKNKDLDFVTKTKTDESFGEKYTNEDIMKLLEEDDFSQKVVENREKNIEKGMNNAENAENISDENTIQENLDSNESNENVMPEMHYQIEKQKNDSVSDENDQ